MAKSFQTEANPQQTRKVNSDGSVDVYCKRCRYKISRMPYQGFSSAICYYCATGLPRPLDEDEVPEVINLTEDKVEQRGSSNIIRALGYVRKKVKDVLLGSKKLSKEKKKKSIFEGFNE